MSERKFYRSVVQVEILHEDPLVLEGEESMTLNDIDYAITDGDCSGKVEVVVANEECFGERMVKLLKAQGSDPSFFQLDESGDDAYDV